MRSVHNERLMEASHAEMKLMDKEDELMRMNEEVDFEEKKRGFELKMKKSS